MKNNNAGAILGAFFGGALVGGVIAILFAPKSGSETRGMIRDFVEDEVDMMKWKARGAKEMVEDEFDKYKKKARHMAEEIEEMAEDVKDCVKAERAKVSAR